MDVSNVTFNVGDRYIVRMDPMVAPPWNQWLYEMIVRRISSEGRLQVKILPAHGEKASLTWCEKTDFPFLLVEKLKHP